jgi:uncharacterized protein YgiM (DUF1202 family)
MQKKFIVILFTVVMTLSSALAYAENLMFVQSFKAKVMALPSFKAKVIGEAGKGSKLIFLGRSGNWVKVNYYSKEGYVSALLVSTRPPMEKQGLIKADKSDISHGVRRRASTYTSAAAARGLVQDDRRRLSRDEKVDYEGLEKLEAVTITDDDIAKFVEGGKV